ncbi:hypothetical protein P8452_16981 [Trifolium repens]|nr:hypothetical protein P8452_16981 [Trifolium repens]
MERNWIGVDVEEVLVLFRFLSSPSFFSSRWWRIMLLAEKKICSVPSLLEISQQRKNNHHIAAELKYMNESQNLGSKRSDREMERNWIGVDVEEVLVLFRFLSSPSFFSSRWWRIMLLAEKKICRWKDQFAFESM